MNACVFYQVVERASPAEKQRDIREASSYVVGFHDYIGAYIVCNDADDAKCHSVITSDFIRGYVCVSVQYANVQQWARMHGAALLPLCVYSTKGMNAEAPTPDAMSYHMNICCNRASLDVVHWMHANGSSMSIYDGYNSDPDVFMYIQSELNKTEAVYTYERLTDVAVCCESLENLHVARRLGVTPSIITASLLCKCTRLDTLKYMHGALSAKERNHLLAMANMFTVSGEPLLGGDNKELREWVQRTRYCAE